MSHNGVGRPGLSVDGVRIETTTPCRADGVATAVPPLLTYQNCCATCRCRGSSSQVVERFGGWGTTRGKAFVSTLCFRLVCVLLSSFCYVHYMEV